MELLAPAGNMEKFLTAIRFGADAVYLSGKAYGLRAFAGNFELDEIKSAVEIAHGLNKKVYVTVNIVAHNRDFENLTEYLKFLESVNVDAIIVSDVGIINLARKVAPKLDVHVSTQANITNKFSAKFFCDLGVKRLVLARELSLKEIKEIRDYIPKDVELETFVHGAMCISYSGRCLLSNYLRHRDSNNGACVQACRWAYTIKEMKSDDEFGIQEDDRGTYILNSKDLCLIEHLKELEDAGITSFKIEGRMKSVYYVANVVNAYRRAIDGQTFNYMEEVKKSSHRNYTTGFYFDEQERECLEQSTPVSTHDFVGVVIEDTQNGVLLIEQRNMFKVGDELEILSPNENFNKKIVVKFILDEDNNNILEARKVQQKLSINSEFDLKKGDILRKKI